ncbi:ribosomal maturation YjgA family protein [Mucilaginibacter frigoritolerans]|uniref:ribosomal maturation YjgA family protein n=1 Tax=Mucilaginibacter frigoritolerans TaxID=652788 RepID=UPI001FE898A9|nr:DUF2809 domain-containing protein [Mucilaginibacter frigoritolerans]
MLKPRLSYFILIIITIILGLLSRHIAGIPLFVGDILWALMVYFIVRFLFITRSIKWVSIVSLLFCYAIEFSQLYQAPWINNIRHTVIGGLILGETFLWGDMLCYTIGIAIGIIVEILIANGCLKNTMPH